MLCFGNVSMTSAMIHTGSASCAQTGTRSTAAPQAARTATAVQNSNASSPSIAPAAAQPSMNAQKIVSVCPAEKQEETRRRGAGTARTPKKDTSHRARYQAESYSYFCLLRASSFSRSSLTHLGQAGFPLSRNSHSVAGNIFPQTGHSIFSDMPTPP